MYFRDNYQCEIQVNLFPLSKRESMYILKFYVYLEIMYKQSILNLSYIKEQKLIKFLYV